MENAFEAAKKSTTNPHNETILAPKMLSSRIGSGIRIVKSRRSGNNASHSSTVTNPMIAIENVRKSSLSGNDAASASAGGWYAKKLYFGISQKQTNPGAAIAPIILAKLAVVSPSPDTSSLSKKRP